MDIKIGQEKTSFAVSKQAAFTWIYNYGSVHIEAECVLPHLPFFPTILTTFICPDMLDFCRRGSSKCSCHALCVYDGLCSM
jgi:hypothetical protein